MKRGLFITFEGGEGAGKTTQIKKLADKLPKCWVTREPGGTPEADAIREVFVKNNGQNWPPEALVFLMFSARIIHTKTSIIPELESGIAVLCDRYTDSTRVYQGGPGMSREKIEEIKKLAIGDFEPDITFILDIPPEEGLKRAAQRNKTEDTFEKKDITFHQFVRKGFLKIAEDYPNRCVVIDALQDEDTIAVQILERVKNHV